MFWGLGRRGADRRKIVRAALDIAATYEDRPRDIDLLCAWVRGSAVRAAAYAAALVDIADAADAADIIRGYFPRNPLEL
jgi:hypothetical protein